MLITKNGGRIPHEVAQKLVANYKDKKEPHLKKAMGGKPETTSVWFDYDFCIMLMQDLLRKEINGLRIYFGAYDKDHSDPDNREKMTAIFVTTKGTRTAEEGEDDLTPAGATEEEFMYEYNEGKICPPKCPTTGYIKL